MVGVVEIGLASRSALTTISTSIGPLPILGWPSWLGHIPMSQNSTAAHLSEQLPIGRISRRQTRYQSRNRSRAAPGVLMMNQPSISQSCC